MSEKKEKVMISKELYDTLEKKAKEKNFKTVENYIEHLLSQLIQTADANEIDPEEEEEIKRRLESLGYL